MRKTLPCTRMQFISFSSAVQSGHSLQSRAQPYLWDKVVQELEAACIHFAPIRGCKGSISSIGCSKQCCVNCVPPPQIVLQQTQTAGVVVCPSIL